MGSKFLWKWWMAANSNSWGKEQYQGAEIIVEVIAKIKIDSLNFRKYIVDFIYFSIYKNCFVLFHNIY
jgi:hypothetical protein